MADKLEDMKARGRIGLEAGEEVEWELLDRGELHLVRLEPSPPRGHQRSDRGR